MKKMLFLALVAMTVATMTACNKEHQGGPEYQTPTDIEGIVFWSKGKNPSSPIAADQPVVVNATLSNPYRLYLALIRYTVDQSAVTTPSEDYEPGVERTASEVEYEPARLVEGLLLHLDHQPVRRGVVQLPPGVYGDGREQRHRRPRTGARTGARTRAARRVTPMIAKTSNHNFFYTLWN